MSNKDLDGFEADLPRIASAADGTAVPRQFNRIREARQQQGMTLECASQKLGLKISEARDMEDPTSDVRLSVLYAWHKVLRVPVQDLLVDNKQDLLVDNNSPLASSMAFRIQMIQLAKSANAILEQSREESVRELAQKLIEEIVKILSELR